jgi:hypothetical protein
MKIINNSTRIRRITILLLGLGPLAAALAATYIAPPYPNCTKYWCSGTLYGDTYYWCCDGVNDVCCGDVVDLKNGKTGLYCMQSSG